VNPTWIKGMQAEGYAGAGAMREFVEYLWGWDATATEVVDDAMWQETYETYVEDKQHLGMKEYFEANSPFAYQDITARMIETIRKDHWNADEATRAKLVSEYLDSVAKHGVNCTDVSCGNGRLLRYVMEEAAKSGVPAPVVAKARAAIEKAMGRTIESAATELESFARRNDARAEAERAENARLVGQVSAAPAEQRSQRREAASAPGEWRRPPDRTSSASQPPENAPRERPPLSGQVMTEEEQTVPQPAPVHQEMPVLSNGGLLWPAALFLLLLAIWRWRELRQAGASRVNRRWGAAPA
jgi:cobaltochelatase CobN